MNNLITRSVNIGQPINYEHSLNNGLLAWWNNIESTINGRQIRDLTGRYHAQKVGAIGVRGGNPGGVRSHYFSSSGAYADATLPSFTSPFTIALWAYHDIASYGYPNSGVICHSNVDDVPRVMKFSVCGAAANNGVCDGAAFWRLLTPTTTMPVRVWTHWGFSWKNGTQAMYMNGLPNGTGTHAYDMATTTLVRLGSSYTSNCFFGMLNDVRLYNRYLTATEWANLYKISRGGNIELFNWRGIPLPRAAAMSACPNSIFDGGIFNSRTISAGGVL